MFLKDEQESVDRVSTKRMSIKVVQIDWIVNFLINRQQVIVAEDASSDPDPVLSGIPQGTVLGPLLILMYQQYAKDNITRNKIKDLCR